MSIYPLRERKKKITVYRLQNNPSTAASRVYKFGRRVYNSIASTRLHVYNVYMNGDEVKERVDAANKIIVSRDRIDWYERNVPTWWKALNDLFADPIWLGNDLNAYCYKWFGCGQGEMRAFLKGQWRDYQLREAGEGVQGRETSEKEFQAASKIVFKVDRQERQEPSAALEGAPEGLDKKAKKALRQARWRAKQKEKA